MSVLDAPLLRVAQTVTREFGQAVTFTRTTNVYDETTGQVTPTTTSIVGRAIQEPDDVVKYKALEIVVAAGITLMFAPAAGGLAVQTDAFVLPGDTFTWNGSAFTVKHVAPTAPSGIAIAGRIVGSA
jgi:hypothetical protein